ncbi:hypothetical protein [Streptomyces sp. NPDC059378]
MAVSITYEARDGFCVEGTAEKAAARIGRLVKVLSWEAKSEVPPPG